MYVFVNSTISDKISCENRASTDIGRLVRCDVTTL